MFVAGLPGPTGRWPEISSWAGLYSDKEAIVMRKGVAVIEIHAFGYWGRNEEWGGCGQEANMDLHTAELILEQASHQWLVSRSTTRWTVAVDCTSDGEGIRNPDQLEGNEPGVKSTLLSWGVQKWVKAVAFWTHFDRIQGNRKIPTNEAGRSSCGDRTVTRLVCPSRWEGDTKKGEPRRDFCIFCYRISISLACKVSLAKTFWSRIIVLNFFLSQKFSVILWGLSFPLMSRPCGFTSKDWH